MGVFLGPDQPNQTPQPPTLAFAGSGANVPGGTDFSELAPLLKQVFFIGDGRTSTGAVQSFVVPQGATRLFLGTMDGWGWYNNIGSFRVTVSDQPEEPGLAGWSIYLDQNQNGRLDPVERSTTTDQNGNYAFTNLVAGSYTVAEVPQPGWVQTAPTTGTYQVTVSAGQVVSGIDFGNEQSSTPPVNHPPHFVTTAPTSATAGQLLRYDAKATDPDQNPLTYDLVVKLDGMGVDPTTGTIVWIPAAKQLGPQNVTLRVQDQ